MGTHVVSGTARALVVGVGRDTEFGRVAERLRLRPPENEFERGVRRFGAFLLELTLVMVMAIFAFNLIFHRHLLDSALFSLALAVGLTPQLLPTIISVNLSRGAAAMAKAHVIVKRLASIENFGSMDVLCSDKTGTLTQGRVSIHSTLDVRGRPSQQVLRYACLNACFESGFPNPIDEALRRAGAGERSAYEKLDELPYDFVRKRLSVAVRLRGRDRLITKGAVPQVLAACAVDPAERARIVADLDRYARDGLRVIAVADRPLGDDTASDDRTQDDRGLRYLGAVLFADPPKADAAAAVAELKAMGVAVKMVSGDAAGVALHVARAVGLRHEHALTGVELDQLRDEALWQAVDRTDVCAEVDPR